MASSEADATVRRLQDEIEKLRASMMQKVRLRTLSSNAHFCQKDHNFNGGEALKSFSVSLSSGSRLCSNLPHRPPQLAGNF